MSRPLAVFRADGTPHIGLGHLVRCAALAEALDATGWDCAFAISAGSAAGAARLLSAHWPIVILADSEPRSEAASLAGWRPDGCRLLVVDHYHRDARFENACRSWAEQILVIDDLADRPHDCDVLIDQSPDRDASDYSGLVPAHCRIATGLGYALLRSQFRRLRPAALARRAVADEPRRLLISMGGTDAADITSRVIDAAAGIPVDIDVVMGAAAPHLATVTQHAETADSHICVHAGVAGIGELMVAADLAAGAAGMSAWERCCLGLPSIVLVAADNQRPGARFLAAQDAAVIIDDRAGPSPAAIADALRRLMKDAALRRGLAQRAASLCDGRGVLRALLTLPRPATARNGGAVTLRLAEPDDSRIMYAWQIAPETRRYARRPSIPTLAEHIDWFEKALWDPARLLTTICHRGTPVGVLRFDQLAEAASFEVSIAVAPERHGSGIGSAALQLARELMPGARLVAEVDPANLASRRLFEGAQFRVSDERHLEWTGPARPSARPSLPAPGFGAAPSSPPCT